VRLVAVQRGVTGRIELFFGAAGPTALSIDGSPLDVAPQALAGGHLVETDVAAATVKIAVDGLEATLAVAEPERAQFVGLNVLLGLRHGESADTVAEWLRFHARVHGAEAALILDCGDREEGETFVADLGAGLGVIPGLAKLMVVASAAPLGRADLPPAPHPYNAPAAPGKARMANLAPDPARAPLAEPIVFEVLRRRFLADARAVLSMDVSDLALPSPQGSVFDRALGLPDGYLGLPVREVYPWRLKQGRSARFADHVCVPFDLAGRRRRWAVAASRETGAVWRMTRLQNIPERVDPAGAVRCVALRHPGVPVSALVPKSSLVEDRDVLELSRAAFGEDPVRMPAVLPRRTGDGPGHVTVVTCMRNEGPFILEWLAFHRSIGIERFLVYSNDCTDGTDRLLDLLQARGLVEHRENPYRETGQRPQHAAFLAAETEPIVEDADWIVCMDVDEFINVHAGDGKIADLLSAVGDANLISMTWRLFGSGDVEMFEDVPVTRRFTRCAALAANKPHQAWGFKTLFRHQGFFRKLGVHRPKGLVPQLKDHIRWVNGSGRPMPEGVYRNAWRSTTRTVGYDLVTLNHYAVRSAESFLVKRDRGRVNHVDRDQGLLYWFRMNNNTETDHSIVRRLSAMEGELARLKADPAIKAAHDASVAAHRERIEALKERQDYAALYEALVSERLRKLSRLHPHFGSGVFWSGPHVVPDDVVERDPGEAFFFTATPEGKGH
jgi:hypothetical protein